MNSRVYAVVMISSLALCPGKSQGMEPVTLVTILAATKAAATWAAPYVIQYSWQAAPWLISAAAGYVMNSDRGPGFPTHPNGPTPHLPRPKKLKGHLPPPPISPMTSVFMNN